LEKTFNFRLAVFKFILLALDIENILTKVSLIFLHILMIDPGFVLYEMQTQLLGGLEFYSKPRLWIGIDLIYKFAK